MTSKKKNISFYLQGWTDKSFKFVVSAAKVAVGTVVNIAAGSMLKEVVVWSCWMAGQSPFQEAAERL